MDIVDLMLINASQIITCASPGGPKRGKDMRVVDAIENGAVAIHEGRILDVGSTPDLLRLYTGIRTLDACGRAVCPGFVDPHTHAVFGGDRTAEFELRIKGASYMEIMAAGGGIVNTVLHTRQSSEESLLAKASSRLDDMLELGTTTVEIKTGYGLDTATELKMLRVIEGLATEHHCDVVPTFLGAHTVPEEYGGDSDAYTKFVIQEMMPEVVSWYRESSFAQESIPIFVDVFCEDHAFNVEQSRSVLNAGMESGFLSKIHVDQFNDLGGVEMAIELGVISADHLDATGQAGLDRIAQSGTIAVPLPAVNFNLGSYSFADARSMLDAGAAVALATDINPGSAP
ncbi:MAG: imidazolonepropionase, partial [Candidatus Latescibacteria bacterium]|nr:imidazolonepropionase [Candidatus Latescibacterota bacterium]